MKIKSIEQYRESYYPKRTRVERKQVEASAHTNQPRQSASRLSKESQDKLSREIESAMKSRVTPNE